MLFIPSLVVGTPSPSSSVSRKSGFPSPSVSWVTTGVHPLSGSKASSKPSPSVSIQDGAISWIPLWFASFHSIASVIPSPSESRSSLFGIPSPSKSLVHSTVSVIPSPSVSTIVIGSSSIVIEISAIAVSFMKVFCGLEIVVVSINVHGSASIGN
jgi:hypothetical protein